jgi:hypothetical protein
MGQSDSTCVPTAENAATVRMAPARAGIACEMWTVVVTSYNTAQPDFSSPFLGFSKWRPVSRRVCHMGRPSRRRVPGEGYLRRLSRLRGSGVKAACQAIGLPR